ncbi:hypothetical protein ACHHYP_10635 [Achlya hypogyna]|uniref:Uncharacterized protein n=1 Tax=Achlya hypogyna TaxID=1202772 RepID=A0A1V9YKU1_ACHHY|nr:hypothetical protein ACHHYP_10635 [Achlya hypogyna]
MATRAVLLSADVLGVITDLQRGLPELLRPAATYLCRVQQYRQHSYAIRSALPAPADFPLDLDTAASLHKRRPDMFTAEVLDHLAATNVVAVVTYLLSVGATCSVWALDEASERGHEGMVRLLHAVGNAGCTTHAMDYAAANGHLNIVQFLHQHRTEGCSLFAMTGAIMHGHLHVVRYLNTHRREGYNPRAMDLAAAKGYLDVITYVHNHRREGCTRDALTSAAKHGHASIVALLDQHRDEGCVNEAFVAAAGQGHLEVVRYLWATHAAQLGAFVRTARNAAETGNHEAVVGFLAVVSSSSLEQGVFGSLFQRLVGAMDMGLFIVDVAFNKELGIF